MNGEFGMLTGENPMTTQLSDKENKDQNEKAFQWLVDKNYVPQTIFGKYDNSEISFFVKGLKTNDAIDFAIEFNQESVATDKGMVYQDGSYNPMRRKGTNFIPTDNYYSGMNVAGNTESSSIEYDWDVRVYPTDPIHGQPAKANLTETADGYLFYQKDGKFSKDETAGSRAVIIPQS
jgi:hypothetical protein